MALRGKDPEEIPERLKLLMSGPAGVGKTKASNKMPKPYIIDSERGTVHYKKDIKAAGGKIFESSDIVEVTREVRSLITESHDYLTVVIDSMTPIYDAAVDEAELVVGTEWGAHHNLAAKQMKRLFGLLTIIDMNVIVTSHEKKEYEGGEIVGVTFDGWKKLDYLFDLWIKLSKVRGKPERYATVAKTRFNDEFPCDEVFLWSYDELSRRFGKERLEKRSQRIALATAEQVSELNSLIGRLSKEEYAKLKLGKAIGGDPADLEAERAAKAIEFISNHLRGKE